MADTQSPVEPQPERAVPPKPPPGTRNPNTGLTVGGWILAGLGGLLVIAGVALVIVHLTQRDKDGYYTSSTIQVAAPGYAVTAEGLRIANLPSFTNDVVGRVRVSARSNNGRSLFVGIASQNALNSYLGGVARNQVTDVNGSTPSYARHAGRAPTGPPASQGFWHTASSGRGQVTATWKVRGGDWAIAVMNTNGSRNVSAAVIVGANTNLVLWIGLGLLLLGLICGGAGSAMLLSNRRR
ncbi:MAG: hypothetical protein ACTHQQ_15925 [Solirubrobacteraceae bacterium]